jgi:hypothetical protein
MLGYFPRCNTTLYMVPHEFKPPEMNAFYQISSAKLLLTVQNMSILPILYQASAGFRIC